MICPHCKEQGLTSHVTPGPGISTAMHCPPFYDEQGRRHHHDYNSTTVTFRCSRGHSFERSLSNSCWCGWTSASGQ